MRFIGLSIISIILFVSPAFAQTEFALPDELDQTLEGYDACVIIRDRGTGETLTNDEARCATRYAPNSTFKIFNALIGLETGVVENERSVLPWDGEERLLDVWEHQHTLTSAIHYSVVPYFQELARRVGRDRMQAALDAIPYGDRHIGEGLDTFWLRDGITISPAEQIDLLDRLYASDLPFTEHNQALVRAILIQDYRPGRTFSGKTGSGWDGEHFTQGWFVGYLQSEDDEYVFAIHIRGGEDPRGSTARGLIIDILEAMELY
jgi:bla regulator protein BlaR1